MRTWKQGVTGKMILPDSRTLFLKCLKYPLAIFYEQYDAERPACNNELFRAFLDLGTLKYIERTGSATLTTDEKRLGNQFTLHHWAGSAELKRTGFASEAIPLTLLRKGRACSIEDIQAHYSMDQLSRRV